jgi:formylmethanofuran dehydrogenase subunit B
MGDLRVEHVTCLGCGCGCDDLVVTVRDGRITQVEPVCPVGRAWFGDGTVPGEVLRSGRATPIDAAIAEAARLLTAARGRGLVYLGADLTSQAQRHAVALADLLGSSVETATSNSAAAGILVAQRRGRAGATLGEVRNRGDTLLFWGVDPAERYPRFMSRFVDPPGTHVPAGRRGRTIIGVSIGRDPAPKTADITLALSPDEEIAALSLLRATVQGKPATPASPRAVELNQIADRLTTSRYVALIHDAEPGGEPRNPLRAEALIALAQTLNQPTRAALISLRAGGNSVGAESVLTWQTGYPLSVNFGSGWPRYQPGRPGLEELRQGRFRAVLIVGSVDFDRLAPALSGAPAIVIGPRASRSRGTPDVAIDTGVAGIHENGTGYRLDDLPLQLRPPLEGPRTTREVLESLIQAVSAAGARDAR